MPASSGPGLAIDKVLRVKPGLVFAIDQLEQQRIRFLRAVGAAILVAEPGEKAVGGEAFEDHGEHIVHVVAASLEGREAAQGIVAIGDALEIFR